MLRIVKQKQKVLIQYISLLVMEKLNTSTDSSASRWLSDLLLEEMEDCNLFQQCHWNLLGDEEFLSHDIASALEGENLQQPVASESYSPYPPSNSEMSLERRTKQLKTKHTLQDLSPSSSPSSRSSQILSFEKNSNSLSPPNTTHFYHGFDCTLNPKQNEVVPLSPLQLRNVNFKPQTRKGSSKNKSFETINPQGQGTKRSLAHAQDHIIAERKRRQKLSQSLIALAALIPGLKKIDKASVLGDAVKYVKELQERLRLLEERNKKSSAAESAMMVNKPQLSGDDHSSSSDDGIEATSGNSEALPHVDARVSEKDVLIRIHCQKQNGLLLKILVEIQNLHLFVVNSSVQPFGDSILGITIVAQMGTGYNLTINDLVKNLRVAALRSMS